MFDFYKPCHAHPEVTGFDVYIIGKKILDRNVDPASISFEHGHFVRSRAKSGG
jgi:hypothetical protein